MKKKIILTCSVLILLVSLLPSATSADFIHIKSSSPPGLPNFYVNNDWEDLEDGTVVIELIIDYIIGENAFAKIQDAIDKAWYHDVIYVFQGTYNENLVITGERDYLKIRGIYGWEDPDPMGENIISGSAGEPVILIESDYIEIFGLIITNNGINENGIVDNGLYTEIYDNTFENIGGTGIVLNSISLGCEIYHNNFINNGQNALDNSYTTEETFSNWYKDQKGNYWDDHPGGLKRNRQVWLKPYNIPGSAESEDPYPLINVDGKEKSRSVNPLKNILQKIFLHFLFQ